MVAKTSLRVAPQAAQGAPAAAATPTLSPAPPSAAAAGTCAAVAAAPRCQQMVPGEVPFHGGAAPSRSAGEDDGGSPAQFRPGRRPRRRGGGWWRWPPAPWRGGRAEAEDRGRALLCCSAAHVEVPARGRLAGGAAFPAGSCSSAVGTAAERTVARRRCIWWARCAACRRCIWCLVARRPEVTFGCCPWWSWWTLVVACCWEHGSA